MDSKHIMNLFQGCFGSIEEEDDDDADCRTYNEHIFIFDIF